MSKNYFGIDMDDMPFDIEVDNDDNFKLEDLFKEEQPKFEENFDTLTEDVSNAFSSVLLNQKTQSITGVGQCIKSLPMQNNPFFKQTNIKEEGKLTSKDTDIIFEIFGDIKLSAGNLFQQMEGFATQNPDSVFATAFATDNPESQFAQENPDLVLTTGTKSSFIEENKKIREEEKKELEKEERKTGMAIAGAATIAIHGLSKIFQNAHEQFEDKKFGEFFGKDDRTNSFTDAMEEAMEKNLPKIIDIKDGSQLLLDPREDGGLNIFQLFGDENEKIASFNEKGEDEIGNAKKILTKLAAEIEKDKDSIKDLKDLWERAPKEIAVEPTPENMLLSAFENINKINQQR